MLFLLFALLLEHFFPLLLALQLGLLSGTVDLVLGSFVRVDGLVPLELGQAFVLVGLLVLDHVLFDFLLVEVKIYADILDFCPLKIG